ncbi:MAG: class I SAM-dependent methyltransferase [Tepidisphaeraceae bacterium]
MDRVLEPELMDLPDEVDAYARANFADVNRRFVERLLEVTAHVPEQADAHIRAIDLGCGPGDITLRLATAREFWNVCGVDASTTMIDRARAETRTRHLANLTFEVANIKEAHKLGTADVVCSNSMLHHLPDPMVMWQAVKRILVKGGTLFIRDLARPETPQVAQALVDLHAAGESKLLRDEFYRSFLAAFTVDEVKTQLRDAGLGHLSVRMSSDRHMDIYGQI